MLSMLAVTGTEIAIIVVLVLAAVASVLVITGRR